MHVLAPNILVQLAIVENTLNVASRIWSSLHYCCNPLPLLKRLYWKPSSQCDGANCGSSNGSWCPESSSQRPLEPKQLCLWLARLILVCLQLCMLGGIRPVWRSDDRIWKERLLQEPGPKTRYPDTTCQRSMSVLPISCIWVGKAYHHL